MLASTCLYSLYAQLQILVIISYMNNFRKLLSTVSDVLIFPLFFDGSLEKQIGCRVCFSKQRLRACESQQ